MSLCSSPLVDRVLRIFRGVKLVTDRHAVGFVLATQDSQQDHVFELAKIRGLVHYVHYVDEIYAAPYRLTLRAASVRSGASVESNRRPLAHAA